MTDSTSFQQKSEIARKILAYLTEHPDAQDTLEGIMDWWLVERNIKDQTLLVREVLRNLIEEGLIVEHEVQGSRAIYRLNRR